MIKVACVLSEVDYTTIPIDNFLALDPKFVKRTLVVLNTDYKKVRRVVDSKNLNCKDVEIKCFENYRFYFAKCVVFLLFLSKSSFDILHSHHSLSALLASVSSLFNKRTKHIVTIHSQFSKYRLLVKFCFYFSMLISKKIIANSYETKKYIFKAYPNRKTSVIYNGSMVYQDNTQTMISCQDKFCIGTVSRLTPVKDHSTLIKAYFNFCSEHDLDDDTRLVIVGDGELRGELTRLAIDLGIENKVIFRGMLKRSEAMRVLSHLDIFVVSSLYEGFCNAMVEAMFLRVPIIATKIPVLEEVLGVNNGLMFKVGSDKELSNLIGEFYANNISINTEGAFMRANDFFTILASSKKHQKIYKNTVTV